MRTRCYVQGAVKVRANRRNALTVLARLSSHRLDLREIIVEALVDHFPQCAHDVVAVATETTEHLSRLAETAFLRLESAVKGQVAGLLRSQLQEESVRLAELHVLVTGFLVEKWRQRKEKKPLNSSDLAEYAKVLGNHAVALGRSGRTDQALVCEREVRNSFEGLVRKDRRRHEPDYATSLSNYAAYLSEVGQSDEALEHAKQALEIRRRLAQTRPDRYEPDYAGSLSNYANGLSAVGQSDEALEHAKQALEIRRRLAQARPDRFEDTRLSASCLMHFLSWLCDRHATDSPLPDPNAIPETIRPRRRPVLVLYTAFVQGCLAADEASRAKAFEQVHLAWDILPLADRSAVRDCWLCAAAWCETLVPEMLAQVDWQAEWRSFKTQRHGRVPHWMVEVARRLSFRWPS